MSSDDAGDSDFDKEAEREKLREKYEQDKKDRENTQRMSELLLQGATMTGKHCSACGDPIFRYDGQEFCPTCQREVEGGAGDGSDQTPADRTAGDTEQSGEPTQATRPEDGEATDESPDSGDEPRVEINDVRVADRHADPNRRTPPSQQDRNGGRREAERQGSGQQDAGTPHGHGSAPGAHDAAPNRKPTPRSPDAASGDLESARASLVRQLNDFARRAEETEDVSRARELLAATREAADALAALDRTGR